MTTRPPPGSRPSDVMTVSISASLRTGAAIGSTLSDRAAASNEGRKYDPPPGAVSGLNMTAARLTPGAISVSNSSHLPAIDASRLMKPVIFPPGRGRPATKPAPTGSETPTNTIGIVRVSRWSAAVTGVDVCEDHVGLQVDQLFREHPHPVDVAGGPTNVHPQIAAIGPTQLRKPLRERGEPGLSLRIVFVARHQHADPPHAVGLLRARRQRPRRRAPKPRDELPPPHPSCLRAAVRQQPTATTGSIWGHPSRASNCLAQQADEKPNERHNNHVD